ncbi:MAG: glycoside hydrolase family 36 protein [Bacteroidota bacterium]
MAYLPSMQQDWSIEIIQAGQLQRYQGRANLLEWSGGQARVVIEALALGQRLRVLATATQLPDQLRLLHPRKYKKTDRLLANGWQSWSETRTYAPGERIKPLRRIARPYMGFYGDYHHELVGRGPNRLHSWSWAQISQLDTDEIELLASCNEQQAFTLFEYQVADEQVRITPDLAGWVPAEAEEICLLDLCFLQGSTTACYDAWQQALAIAPTRLPPQNGWTSWYQYYQHINPGLLHKVLAAMAPRLKEGDIFQVDDGYAAAIGDWLKPDAAFQPGDMPQLAEAIRKQGLRPGIWLAPTVAADEAELLQEQPELILKDRRGRPLKAGYNPGWGGYYRALDTEHPAWMDYIEKVIQTQCQDWGYRMLKLDFLFTACLYPRAGFTRAQLMHRCLQRLRDWAGPEVALLGCGTPLASGFGLFDYCRISADIHLKWEHRMLAFLRHRERVSTRIALRSTAFRYPLNGRMWQSDPDVFLLRDENQQLSKTQRAMVLQLNTLLGDLCFTSDDPTTYGSWQEEQWQWFMAHQQEKVLQLSEVAPLQLRLTTEERSYRFDLNK